MRSLNWHCVELWYADVKAASRPADIEPTSLSEVHRASRSVLLSFVTVQRSDDEAVALALADDVCALWGLSKPRGGVVVMPFGHLASDLAEPSAAIHLLEVLARRIESRELAVHLASFGTHKDLLLSSKGFEGAVAFRERTP